VILATLAAIALAAGTTTVEASERQLSERAGVALRTVKRQKNNLGAFVERKACPPMSGKPTRWRLRVEAARPMTPAWRLHAAEASKLVSLRAHIGDDYFDRAGSRLRTYSALGCAEGISVKQLAGALSVHPGTIRRNLRRLEADHVALCEEGLWYLLAGPLPQPETSPSQRRRGQHARDREEFELRRRLAAERRSNVVDLDARRRGRAQRRQAS
jgi:hypothetical protein